MRFTLAILAIAASSVSATLVSRQATLPTCATNCLFGPNVDLGGCSQTDNVCLCKSQTFISKSTACIESACSGSDLQAAISAAQQICASVGITLSSIPAPASSTGAASSTKTGSPSPSVTSGSSKPTATSPSSASSGASGTSAPASSGSASGPATPSTSNAARSNAANTFAGIAAIGLAAIAL